MAITPRHRLDVFLARNAEAGTGLTPLLAFIHGGFWHSHDKSEFSFIAAPFVHAGITVALINYPLAPSVPLDEIVRSVGACIQLAARPGPPAERR